MNTVRLRVGVISLYGLENFGNRLQNWAVHYALTERGYDPVNIIFPHRDLRAYLGHFVRETTRIAHRQHIDIQRRRSFRQFDSHMKRHTVYFRQQLQDIRKAYCCFVVGSDQIWSPYSGRYHEFQFLNWASPKQKIALSPSFGVTHVPTDKQAAYAEWLTSFAELSVREDAGAKIIEDLTGRKARVLIDPTLSIEANAWRRISSPRLRPREPYVLTYFLGETDAEWITYISETASTHEARIISLLDRSDSLMYTAGPAEFLDLIDNAACVFTDSFHGSAFSLVFGVPLVVFPRRGGRFDVSSRLDTFLSTFALQDRLFGDSLTWDPFSCDYTEATEILSNQRAEYFAYLEGELHRACL